MDITLKNCDWINQVSCCDGDTVYPLTTASQVEVITSYDSHGNPITISLQEWLNHVVYSDETSFITLEDVPISGIPYSTSSMFNLTQGEHYTQFPVYTPIIKANYDGVDYADHPWYGMIKISSDNFIIDSDSDIVSLDLGFEQSASFYPQNGYVVLGNIINHSGSVYGDSVIMPVPEIVASSHSGGLVFGITIGGSYTGEQTIPWNSIVSQILNNSNFNASINRYSLVYSGGVLTLWNSHDLGASSSVSLDVPQYVFDPTYFTNNNNAISIVASSFEYTAASGDTITVDNTNKEISHSNVVTPNTVYPTYSNGVLNVPSVSYDKNGHILSAYAQPIALDNQKGLKSLMVLEDISGWTASNFTQDTIYTEEGNRFFELEIPVNQSFLVDIIDSNYNTITYRFVSDLNGVITEAQLHSIHNSIQSTVIALSTYGTYVGSALSTAQWPSSVSFIGLPIGQYLNGSLKCFTAVKSGVKHLFIGNFVIDENGILTCSDNVLPNMGSATMIACFVRASSAINIWHRQEFFSTDENIDTSDVGTSFFYVHPSTLPNIMSSHTTLSCYNLNPYWVTEVNSEEMYISNRLSDGEKAELFIEPTGSNQIMNLYHTNSERMYVNDEAGEYAGSDVYKFTQDATNRYKMIFDKIGTAYYCEVALFSE